MTITNPLKAIPWARLVKVWKPFWSSDQRGKALFMLATTIVLLFASVGVNWGLQKLNAELWTAIQQKSQADTNYWLLISVATIAPVMLVQVYYGYFRTKLALIWRQWFAASLFTGYYANQAATKINGNPEIDNPDARMTSDVDQFCNQSVWLPISFIETVVTIATFGGTLIYLSWQLSLASFLCAAVMSVGVVWIGRSLTTLTFMQSKTEGDLRYSLASVREQAETVAFYRGEKVANDLSKKRLGSVIDTLMQIMNVNRNISFFTTSYNMLIPLIPLWLIVPLYFSGEIQFGVISQATGAFAAVYGALCWIPNQFGGLTSYATVINRLGSFMEALEAAGLDTLPPGKKIDVTEGEQIHFEKVTVMTPDLEKQLVTDLTVQVKPGENLLITGPDGSGKTAILRTIAGLWNAGSGKLQRPPAHEVMYLSQSPYLPIVSLREVLTYPMKEPITDDARLIEVLKLVSLVGNKSAESDNNDTRPDSDILTRAKGLDTEQNWKQMLSPSEQQRLGLARIILCKPNYVIVDDATAALETETEQLLYTVLATLNATVVTAGNGAALVKYHRRVLELKDDGTWLLQDASAYQPKKFLDLLKWFSPRQPEE